MNTSELTMKVGKVNHITGFGETRFNENVRSDKLLFSRILIKARSRHLSFETGLVKKIAQGNQFALSKLYERYSRLVYSVAYKIIKNHEETEELVQGVFIKVWNKASAFNETRGNVHTWLMAISRNTAIDWIRSKEYKTSCRNHIKIEDAEIHKDYLYQPDSFIQLERAQIIAEALKSIRQEERVVIDLAFFSGLTQAEIALKLNIPLGTVKTRTRQAFIKLEKVLTESF